MKIAVVTPVWPPYRGGIGTVAYNQARVLGERGFEVTVLTPDYGQDHALTPCLTKEGVRIEFIKPVLKYGNAAWVPDLVKRLKEFDVVILQYPFFGGMRAVYRSKKRHNFKLIVNYNMDVVGSGLKGLVFWYATKFFLPRMVALADFVLASSADYAQHSALGRFWNSERSKFKIIPNGVDVKRFAFSGSPRERLVLFVGGLDAAHYFKGVEYLIKAVPLVGYDDFKVVIAGQGKLRERYERLVEELGVSDRIKFAGGVSDDCLVKLYQMAMVTVLPSIDQSESFGIVLAESLACGTPVIASDLPGVRSVFENNVSGLVVDPRDIQALAGGLKHVLENQEKTRAMGLSGRKLAEEKYDWEEIGDQLNNLIVG